MKIFPLSDPILLPLAPAITSTIADYLQSIAQKHYLNSLNQNCAGIVSELPQDWSWQWQCQRSIRQIPIPQYQYVSTIAHQLAAKSALSPSEICQNLHIPLPALTVETESTPLCWRSTHLDLDCWYTEASDIYFQLSPEAIAIWLNYIHDLPIYLSRRDDNSHSCNGLGQLSPGKIDVAIYAHARCCSLLRLADVAKLVTISDDWQIGTSNLFDDAISAHNPRKLESKCIFKHPVEERLIHALMTVLEGIYGNNWLWESSQSESIEKIDLEVFHRQQKSPNWHKLTIDLARSWLEVHRHCQVFGDLTSQNPRLAVARCGLTAISRRYLELLLVNYLGVDAPIGF